MIDRIVGFELEFVEDCDDFDGAILDHIMSLQQTSNKYFGPLDSSTAGVQWGGRTDAAKVHESKEQAYECIRRAVLDLKGKG